SSRRRHTRWPRDWSSDVCSSDLVWLHEHGEEADLGPGDRAWLLVDLGAGLLEEADPRDVVAELLPDVTPEAQAELVAGLWEVSQIGRASCRERGEVGGGGVA